MEIHSYTLGVLQTNCYILEDPKQKKAVIIDPADDGDFLNDELLRLGVQLEQIVLTHGHFDHCLGLLSLHTAWNVPISMHFADQFLLQDAPNRAAYWLGHSVDPVPPANRDLTDLKEITLLGQPWRIIPTPGHTPGSICLLHESEKVLISGDTIFAHGSVGRTDFAYSSSADLHKSIQTLKELQAQGLYGQVYAGHGESFFA